MMGQVSVQDLKLALEKADPGGDVDSEAQKVALDVFAKLVASKEAEASDQAHDDAVDARIQKIRDGYARPVASGFLPVDVRARMDWRANARSAFEAGLAADEAVWERRADFVFATMSGAVKLFFGGAPLSEVAMALDPAVELIREFMGGGDVSVPEVPEVPKGEG